MAFHDLEEDGNEETNKLDRGGDPGSDLDGCRMWGEQCK